MSAPFPINPRGFWETKDATGHGFDAPLAEAIAELLRGASCRTLMDLGCGTAEYAKHLASRGVVVSACDGNPNTPKITDGLAFVRDLSQPVIDDTRYDWVLSLEVGEHIPRPHEQIFIDNVADSANCGIIISWAIPGQAGDGHFNCRDNDYIIAEFAKRKWEYESELALSLRRRATFPWFHNTIMVFRPTVFMFSTTGG